MIKYISRMRVFFYTFLIMMMVMSCTDSSDSGSGPAVVEGRVESVSSNQGQAARIQQVEGANVTISQVTTGGNLETIGNAETETNAEGQYSLEVGEEALGTVEADSRTIVVAEADEGTGKAFVTSDVVSGTIVPVKPVTVESTVEANVLQEVVANGAEEMVTNADIEVAIDEASATALDGNTAAVSQIATDLANKVVVTDEYYNRQGIEIGLDEVEQLETQAQIQLENNLNDVGGSEEGEENVYTSFLESYANAEMEAGAEATSVAIASELSGHVILAGESEIPQEVVARMYSSNSFETAVALDDAVLSRLEEMGAGESTIAIAEDAGNELQSEIREATDVTVEGINDSFASYSDKVTAAIESDANLEGTTFATVNNIIEGEGGAKSAFESALDGVSDPEFIVDAYENFYSSVRSTVDASFTQADEQRLQAYTDLLILLNIAS